MKTLLAVLVLVAVAWGNSTQYFGWTPNRELVYRFESQVLTGIPEIRDSQYAGIRLTSEVRVQAFSDYSLRVKFEKCRFITINGEVNLSERGRLIKGSETEHSAQTSEIPAKLRMYLEKPFLVHLKRGIVESFFVETSEPNTVTNIKRSFLAQIQLDITGSRRGEIESNHVESQNGLEDVEAETPLDTNERITYFTTREETLLGDCQTSYTIHPLPKYRAVELEREWREEERQLYDTQKVHSNGDEVCRGKQYFRISKTKNLDNCKLRPFYQKYNGIESKCDSSKAACTDVYTHLVSTTCVVCGELNKFVIRKCIKKDVGLVNPLGWNTEENMKSASTISLELLKEESSFSPIPVPSDHKEKKSLIFEFPEANQQVPRGQVEEEIEEWGIKPVMPQPDLLSSPKMLYTQGVNKHEISKQVVEELKRIVTEVFESPESCSSTGDVAGYLATISKYLLPLSYDELKAVKDEVLSASSHSGSQKVLKSLFFDVLSTVGSNPSTMLIKKEIEKKELTGRSAVNALEGIFRSVRTPTKELLKELVELVKNLKNIQHEENDLLDSGRNLYSIGMIQMSNLLHRACINPARKMLEFPVRIYGQFCSNESRIITQEWIPYLETELENPSSRHHEDEHFRLVAITSLGKLGHIKALHPLVKIIDGTISTRPMVRSVAVYSLKRIARLNPVLIKPILLSIIDNPADNTQVRIAAVSVLPWSQPSMAQLQKVAVRTWFEPSKQVASFIYSTLKNLANTEVPELKPVGLKSKTIIHMVKPFQYGAQFAHNINLGEFVDYLKSSVSKKLSWVFNEEEITPAKISLSNKMYNSAAVARGLSFSLYTQGMDMLIDRILYYTNKKSISSESVRDQLEKISQELKIEQPEQKSPMAFIQSRFLNSESVYTLNKEYIMEFFERATESLRRNPQLFSEGKHFEFTRFVKLISVQHVRPNSAGFLSYHEFVLPMVYSVKGFFKGENLIESAIPIPTKVVAKIMPIVNIKMHSHIGVVSPFTDQLIGAGVDAAVHISTPLETEIEVDNMNEVSVTLKTPESIKKSVELVHVYITPYTVKKNLKTLQPISKSSSLKPILSRTPIKKVDLDIGKKLGVSSRLIAESDAEYNDLYSYWEKIKQHSLASIYTAGFLPGSVRKSSLKIVFTPSESETKEFVLRFSLAKGKRSNDQEDEEINYSDEHLIKKICNQHYQKESYEAERCQQHLNKLETVSREAEQLCESHDLQTESGRNKCQKTAEICEKAVKICESHHGPGSSRCQENRESCLNHVNNVQKMKKMLRKMGQQSQLKRLHIHASVKGRYHRNSIQTVFFYGSAVEDQERIVKCFVGAEIEVPERSSVYEISYESKTKMPQINHRWNTEKLVEEEIKMEMDGKIKYGSKENLKELVFKSVMEKSEEQKRSVKSSPEYLKCSEHEQQNTILSPVCMKVRHQAASVDKFYLSIELPEPLRKETLLLRLEEFVKSYFFTQIHTEHDSSVSSPKEYKIMIDISRAGDEAQLKVEHIGQKWVVKDIRLPYVFRGVLPLSMRNRFHDRLIQKLTRNQAPASCRIEPEYIGTFDNVTYKYEINDCMHLLFKDCSGKIPVAVMAKSVSSSDSSKVVEILSGISKVVLKPKSSSEPKGMTIMLKVKDEKKSVELTHGQVHTERCPESGNVLVQMKRYSDNVYNIWFHKEMLQVITDGVRIEIVAPQLVHGRTCGLCGDFNGENTADLRTPRQCLMKKERFVAYSYLLKGESSSSENEHCSGIPSRDLEEFERERKVCIKKREIITSLENVYERLYKLAKPLVSVHMIEKQVNQLCISREKVKICSRKTLVQPVPTTYLEGLKPVEVKPRLVEYSCIPLPSQKAFSMERRAKGGENLQAELYRLPVHFTKTEYEPVLCKPEEQLENRNQF